MRAALATSASDNPFDSRNALAAPVWTIRRTRTRSVISFTSREYSATAARCQDVAEVLQPELQQAGLLLTFCMPRHTVNR
jgi:hypothetical protein